MNISFAAHDRNMANMIMEDMEKINKVKIIPTALPFEINEIDNGKKLVKWKCQKKGSKEIGQDGFT